MIALRNSNAGSRKRNRFSIFFAALPVQAAAGCIASLQPGKTAAPFLAYTRAIVTQSRGSRMKSMIISTAVILAIGLGGAWAERAFSGLVSAVCAPKQTTTAPA